MKEMVIVSVRDLRSRSYGTPVCADTPEMAIRNFRMMLADDRNKMMHDYPEDFVLVQLGKYNELSGEITPVVPAAVLADGKPVQE